MTITNLTAGHLFMQCRSAMRKNGLGFALSIALAPILAAPALPAHAAPRTAATAGIIRTTISSLDGHDVPATIYKAPGGKPAPVLIAVHGGGWRVGDAGMYKEWGPFLAAKGYTVVAIDYRLAKPGAGSWPGAAYDVLAAIAHVRSHAKELGIDPDRIAMIGDSAGAHLSALAALNPEGLLEKAAKDEAKFASHSARPEDYKVRAVVGLYGVYDLAAQWTTDNATRVLPGRISEIFMGRSVLDDRMAYIEASPISYLDSRHRSVAFLIVYGDRDDVVDPERQSRAFAAVARMAGNYTRSIVLPGAGHYWLTESPTAEHSWSAEAAPRILDFLSDIL
ncbi:alpha/beta fold hydrolase [Sphingomonas histidinilytica]|uniref:Acetyl esterase/lipase n=1 Tax=Rhizorhabdus histidinilytica TaxID=439228 RepID=A0A1T5BLI5_9SPHN|nr:alpha/beta hydrolase [Rhizorhabdus histidinilytica]MBO9377410.1 alpha/beta fold hydrolase [Rhizorhabdus histidinilytica]SKB48106.1 Acetyl esterase/lipase [Rhizorhabdus histidinilytica]